MAERSECRDEGTGHKLVHTFVDLLAGLTYSLLSKGELTWSLSYARLADIRYLTGHLRAGCYFLHFVFVYDEFADVLDKDGAQQQTDLVMDALRNPSKPRPEDESLIGEIAQQ